jgi:hypothetical protein
MPSLRRPFRLIPGLEKTPKAGFALGLNHSRDALFESISRCAELTHVDAALYYSVFGH